MQHQRVAPLYVAAVLVVTVLCLSIDAFPASKYKVLHAFGKGTDGAGLWDSLTSDKKGSLYGTTGGGGIHGGGTVFKLTAGTNGRWSERVLHSFDYHTEGAGPTGGLIFDQAGNLYGTTQADGAHNGGDVFELTPDRSGWTERILYSFGTRKNDGYQPYAGVALDEKTGRLYGTAPRGGPTLGGAAFELTPGSDGWQETLVDTFSKKNDGGGPFAGVILDRAGNLYGTTEGGGAHTYGTVYEVQHTSAGWKEHVLHNFPAFTGDGEIPGIGALTIDGSGSLYGTTAGGGCCGGTVFKLTPGTDGHWKETILHEFQGGASGYEPGAGVVTDQAGNLYGTTIAGGSSQCGCGVVYKLARRAKGKWTYTVLHTFTGNDGAQPDANLILDGKGNLYGTTATGGANGAGVVFELTASESAWFPKRCTGCTTLSTSPRSTRFRRSTERSIRPVAFTPRNVAVFRLKLPAGPGQ